MNRPQCTAKNNGAARVGRRSVVLAFLAVLTAARAVAQNPAPLQPNPATSPARRIVVSIPDRKLALLEGDRIIRIYDVAVGDDASPSPGGEYHIAQRLENPTYYHPGVVIGPGSENPLGPRWIGLNAKGFGIHGTNRPNSIGKSASHGCIRLRNRDIQDLFARVKVGDRVSLVAGRTDEVARLFGTAPDPAQSTPTLLATNQPTAAAGPDGETRGER